MLPFGMLFRVDIWKYFKSLRRGLELRFSVRGFGCALFVLKSGNTNFYSKEKENGESKTNFIQDF